MNRVVDRGDLRKYRTEIPNLVDDMDLSVYAFRLYAHLKRVAGDEGICWQSTSTLAKACKMGAASISRAKSELVEKGLIDIVRMTNPHGGKEFHEIRIIDIWAENFETFRANSTQEVASSPGEIANSTQEVASSPGEIKNKPFKNQPRKKGGKTPPKRPIFDDMTVLEIKKVPEIALYMQVTGMYPGQAQLPIIYDVIRTRGFTAGEIKPFWVEWVKRGYRTKNLSWLTEWAVSGNIPGQHGTRASPAEPAGYAAIREFMAQEGENGDEG